MKLVWKLLRQNISKPQLIGFFFANLIGLTIVLLALQFYFDISPVFSEKEKLFKEDYFTITKQVGLLSSLSTKSGGFSSSEIDDLKKQNFVKDVGVFTPSQYNVFAGINGQGTGVGFNTQMFFESVPDKFIDVQSDNWHYSPTGNIVPIILPKDYLDLYNFGFAEANSMPKISESLIGMINMDIVIQGKNGQVKNLKGHIAGFSNRINTILVPESFMEWANQEFGIGGKSNPSRLIVEISNAADPDLANYFKSKGYEISGENTTASKMSFFLKIIVGIVASVGVVICVLSFFILTLSIYLLLEKNMNKLKTLRLIGYSKSVVVKPYERLSLGLNAIILLLSLSIVYIVRGFYIEAIAKILTVESKGSLLYTILIGIGVFLLLSFLNICIIRRKVD
jgi:hypothetical protein